MSFLRLLRLFALALSVVLPVRAWVMEPVVIASASMEPTLTVGTLLILDKWSLRARAPRRGEIVSFRSPINDEDMVKRVIGVPGDVVEIRDRQVIVNGQPLQEDYVVHARADERLESGTLDVMTVPADSYFVLGDNRDMSNDSAVWKTASGQRVYFINKHALQGVVRRLPWAA